MSSYTSKWFFPKLGGGEEQGLNEPGIESFKKGTSLGRETIQNIGDARSKAAIEAGEPAIAEFELLHMPSAEMPGHEELLAIFEACRKHIEKRFHKSEDRQANGLAFIERAIDLLSGQTLPVLRIRDRNTTGLRGADEESDKNSPWWRLVGGQGYSSREGVGGGTYGIGQRAPFAFSELRTIIYYTRTAPKAEAFIAKSILCSFPHPSDGELTQSKGWFCSVPEGGGTNWRGIQHDATPACFRRSDEDDVGTDLYVTGYRNAHGNWRQEIRRAVLRHFFAAIDEGLLSVRIVDGEEQEYILHDNIVDVVKLEAGL